MFLELMRSKNFTAEVTAIDLALDTIAESDDDHFIILSDSLSVLLSLHNKKMDNPLILQLLQKLHHLSCAHKTIHLCWIPSHIGIREKVSHQSFYFKQMAGALVVLP